MANNYLDNKDRWDRLSDMDYLPAFINAWLAFNAWYRNAYDIESDREIVNKIKYEENVIKNSIIPILRVSGSREFRPEQEVDSFRADVGLLHKRLELYHLQTGKGFSKARITFTEIYLKYQPVTPQTRTANGISFSVMPDLNPNGSIKTIETKVFGRNQAVKYNLIQSRYDLAEIKSDAEAKGILTRDQIGFLLQAYKLANPKYIIDLTNNLERAIECGSIEFKCSSEDLFAGIVETLYLMRCHLFHGEMVPSREASACYEPAYRIIKFLLNKVQ